MDLTPFSLAGKTALVTGGNQGIGLGIARGLHQAGASVAICGRDVEANAAALANFDKAGATLRAYQADLTDIAAIPALFAAVAADLGGVDLLVNNAGCVHKEAAEDLDLAAFEAVMRLNVTAGLALSQAFAQARIASGKPGSILCIASLMSSASRPGVAAYTISKGAVLQMVKALAVDWAEHGIRVNGIGPGYVETPMTAMLKADTEFNDWVLGRTPLGRWAQPVDMAGPAVFLLSDAAAYVTGQVLYVDGGFLARL